MPGHSQPAMQNEKLEGGSFWFGVSLTRNPKPETISG